MPTLAKIDPRHIRTDGGTQPRAKIDREVCREYAERMKVGEQFPPVTVFNDGDAYWLADGFHRIDAHQSAFPGQPLQCEVRSGSQTDAQWYSYGVNKTHGIRRTNMDKERAVMAALAHPRAGTLSNRQIAEHCGVDEKTVRNRRQSSAAGGTADVPQSIERRDLATTPESQEVRLRTGRDGRTINTANIGRKKGRKAMRPRSAAEILAARREGRHVRPTDFVKLELPNNNVKNCAYDLLQYFTFEYLEKVFQEIVNLHHTRSQEESAS